MDGTKIPDTPSSALTHLIAECQSLIAHAETSPRARNELRFLQWELHRVSEIPHTAPYSDEELFGTHAPGDSLLETAMELPPRKYLGVPHGEGALVEAFTILQHAMKRVLLA